MNEQLAELPLSSVAVQVTVVAPTGKLEPEGGEQTTGAPEQLSLATGFGEACSHLRERSRFVDRPSGQLDSTRSAAKTGGQSIC